MSIRADLQQVLHVAHPLETQRATSLPTKATDYATTNATIRGAASNDAGLYATSIATTVQQSANYSATLTEIHQETRSPLDPSDKLANLVALRALVIECLILVSEPEADWQGYIDAALADSDDALVFYSNMKREFRPQTY